MAPALASASTNTDSIKGLAQSIAGPAYRRLLVAEPALRRAVPLLIIAFLVTMAIGAAVQVHDHRRQAIGAIANDFEAVADLAAERFERTATAAKDRAPGLTQELLYQAVPARSIAAGREVYLTDTTGAVIASVPAGRMTGRPLIEILGADQPLTTFGAGAGVLELALPNGTEAFATVRVLNAPFGQIAVVQRRDDALAVWRSQAALTLTLSATTGFVVLILGFAFHWQATRSATRARPILRGHSRPHRRRPTRGRCGLWDWDLARGRVFWSHSMFAVLGLAPRDDLLTFGEVNTLVHPDDIALYDIAAQLADGR